jgi:hypothetical protein
MSWYRLSLSTSTVRVMQAAQAPALFTGEPTCTSNIEHQLDASGPVGAHAQAFIFIHLLLPTPLFACAAPFFLAGLWAPAALSLHEGVHFDRVYVSSVRCVFALISLRLLDIAGTGGRVRLASLQRGRPLRAMALGQSRATCLTCPASLVSGRCCDLRRAKACCQSFTRAPHTCTQLSPSVHVTRMV